MTDQEKLTCKLLKELQTATEDQRQQWRDKTLEAMPWMTRYVTAVMDFIGSGV